MPRPEPPPIAKPDNNDLTYDLVLGKHVQLKDATTVRYFGPHGRTTGLHHSLCSDSAIQQEMPRRKKRWRRIMKKWQHFILLVAKSKGRIVKKQLDEYRIALKSYRSDLAQLAKREKFLQRAHEPEN